MKKLIFTLTLILSVFALSAQSYQVVTTDGRVVENGESFYLYGDGAASYGELILNLDVIANQPVSLIAEKVELQVVEGTYNMLCLGQCYAPNVYVSPVVDINGGETKEFSMHYMYENTIEDVCGLEQIMDYYLYPADNTDDKFIIHVIFKYSMDGVEDNNSVDMFSDAYPVPARDVVNFDYNIASDLDAEIAIFNMTGQEVLRSHINGISGKASINVSDLADGVYFYSLIVNGKTEKSNKLVVKK